MGAQTGGVTRLSVRPIDGVRRRPADVVRLAGELSGAVVLTGRWDAGEVVLAADPVTVRRSGPPPFDELGQLPPVAAHPGAVGGGWFGWFAMEGDQQALGLYPNVIRYAHGQWWDEALVGLVADAELERRRSALVAALRAGPQHEHAYVVGAVTTSRDLTAHTRAVERCIHCIRDGEIYQANICLTLEAAFDGSVSGAAAKLVGQLEPAYGAYLDLGGPGTPTVMSASPELFLRRRGRQVTSRPIKGTRPRTDAEGREALATSAKDRAENVMIVDLVRHDLSRVAQIGSVRVPRLLDVTAHPGVWHLVSEVSATLRPDAGDADLLRAAFPPGSVTGAPKHRALEVIAELEDGPRGVYTGAIGYVSPVAGLELSVAIRTFSVTAGRLRLGVGGGITVDSTPAEEWWECFDKARPLLGALGAEVSVADSVRPPPDPLAHGGIFDTCLRRDGRPLEVAEHRARLERSLHELYGRALPAAAAAALEPEAVTGWERQRIDIGPDGAVRVTRTPVASPQPLGEQEPAELVTLPGAGFGRHKWADRRRQEELEARYGERVPVLVDAAGGLLETTRANVFGVRDGVLVTAPLSGGILPGVTRTVVLDLARELGVPVVLEPPHPAEVEALALVGSVAGLRWVGACDGRAYAGPGAVLRALSERLLARWQAGATVSR
jgi:para-aminobenzoate synthetase / 4-amino-4-deoxychorismate lyase